MNPHTAIPAGTAISMIKSLFLSLLSAGVPAVRVVLAPGTPPGTVVLGLVHPQSLVLLVLILLAGGPCVVVVVGADVVGIGMASL